MKAKKNIEYMQNIKNTILCRNRRMSCDTTYFRLFWNISYCIKLLYNKQN